MHWAYYFIFFVVAPAPLMYLLAKIPTIVNDRIAKKTTAARIEVESQERYEQELANASPEQIWLMNLDYGMEMAEKGEYVNWNIEPNYDFIDLREEFEALESGERYSFDKVTAGTISADKIVSGNYIPGEAIKSINMTETYNRIMRREW